MSESTDNAAWHGIPGLTDLQPIGQGGYAVVYRATETDLQRTVAVKVLQASLTDHAKLRFDRERRAMGALSDHPHIVTVYRGGHTPEQQPYLIMEYLGGGSLAEHIAQQGPLQWERAVEIAVQVCGALETAHQAGVLHRDIKPGNILISSLGHAKLADFGIARLRGSPNTRTGLFSATLTHAPPEVISGSRPDERADLYSLGSTLYELLSGSPAFVRPNDESMAAIVARIATEKPARLDERRVPNPIMRVVLDAMSKDPQARPANAADMGERLRAAQRELRLMPTPLLVKAIDIEDDPAQTGNRATVKVDGPPPRPAGPDSPVEPQPRPPLPPPDPNIAVTASRPPPAGRPQPGTPEPEPTVSLTATGDLASTRSLPLDPAATATSPPVDPRGRRTGSPGATEELGSNGSGGAPTGDGSGSPLAASGDLQLHGFSGGSGTGTQRSRRWLWVVAGLVGVAVVASGATVALDPGLVDDVFGTGTGTTEATGPGPTDTGGPDPSSSVEVDPTTPSVTSEPGGGDSGTSVPEPGDGYEFEEIVDGTGTVTLDVPTVWANQGWRGPRDPDPGNPAKEGDVQLTVAPAGASFSNDYEAPGAYLWVDRAPFDDDPFAADASARVSGIDTGCATARTAEAWTGGPYSGWRAEFVDCPGGPATSAVIYSFSDPTGEVLFLIIVHALDGRDVDAGETLAASVEVSA